MDIVIVLTQVKAIVLCREVVLNMDKSTAVMVVWLHCSVW